MAEPALTSFILEGLALNFGVIVVVYVIAAVLQTEKFFDLTATTNLVILTLLSLLWWGGTQHPRQCVQSVCAILWAIRLGSFLTMRVVRAGSEKGFDGVRDHPLKFLVAWIMLGVWTTTNVAPTFIHNIKDCSSPIGLLEYIGWGTWCFGFLIEWLADHQKTQFRAQAMNKDKYITTGLWRLSRHPNYFGEILMWTGLYVSTLNCLQGWEYLAIISPLFPLLLMSQATGRIQERHGMDKWGHDSHYLRYLQDTPYIVPSIYKFSFGDCWL